MRDRDLVRLYWPVELRPAFDALFAIDDVMAEVVASSTQPALGAIRLAWWREALERLDQHPPPAEPRLQAAAEHLLPLGVTGATLAGLEAGHAALLQETVEAAQVVLAGERLFAIGGKLLGADDSMLPSAGRTYAIGAAARDGRSLETIEDMLKMLDVKEHRFPTRLRPLTALTRLARRDYLNFPAVEPEATPARAFALIRHRLTGRIT